MSSATEGPQDSGRISDDPEGWVTGWLRRLADDIEAGEWTLEGHSQCWSRPFTDYEFTVKLGVKEPDWGTS